MRTPLCVALLAVAGCGQEYEVLAPVDVDPSAITPCPFTDLSGTRFRRYDCNPVFTSTDEPWITGGVGSIGFHAEEVLGHPFYQMWYSTGRADGTYGLGYAISADGTQWTPSSANPVFENPGSGWNRDSMAALGIVWEAAAARYVLTYQGVNYDTDGNGLGVLTSPDGRSWTEERGGEPFVQLSEPLNGVRYCWPLALSWDLGGGFHGYIGGTDGGVLDDKCEIYHYGGATLDELSASPDVVLPAGQGPWDRKGVASAAVVKFDETYYMFYIGFRDWQPIPDTNFITPLDTTLNLATSTDGLVWEKSPDNPIDEVSLWQDPSVLGSVAAQVVGRRIHVWIDDYYEDVGGNAVGYFLYEPDLDPFP